MNAEPNRPADDGVEESGSPETDSEETSAADGSNQEQAAPEATPESDELATLQAKVAENWDKYVRAAAELENVRKRAERDVTNAHKFALERFATDLLAVCDSLEMALATEGEASVESLQEGTEATLKLLNSVLERFGVEILDPHGEPFDPTFHEAMTMQPSDDAEPGFVTALQGGLHGRFRRGIEMGEGCPGS